LLDLEFKIDCAKGLSCIKLIKGVASAKIKYKSMTLLTIPISAPNNLFARFNKGNFITVFTMYDRISSIAYIDKKVTIKLIDLIIKRLILSTKIANESDASFAIMLFTNFCSSTGILLRLLNALGESFTSK
jgi:hypothetical protein